MLISPDDPLIADPASPIELWYDTNDVAVGAGFGVPPGGLTGHILRKASDVDGETEWTGAAGDSAIVGDNAGFLTAGGGGIFKKTGGGIVLRRHSNNAEIPIENNDGSNARNIIHAGGGTFVNGAILQFANQADIAKINLYSTTFGFGVTSGTLDVFASSTVKFKQNSITGTLWAYIDATCGGGRVLTDATGAPKNPGWVACTMASGISGSAHYKDLGGAYGIKYAVNKAGANVGDNVHIFNLPAAPPQPFYAHGMNKEGVETSCKVEGTAVRTMSGGGSLDLWGTFVYPKA